MEDKVIKEGKWEFDGEVTKVFPNMLERSIPQYKEMRFLTNVMASHFAKGFEYPMIADIGCSNGLAVEELVKNSGNDYTFVLSDVSEPMLEACREKYRDNARVRIVNHDLRNGVPFVGANVVISCLTLQFTPIEYRMNILKDIYEGLCEGGVFLLVEKVLGNTAKIDNLMVEEYYNIKRNNGYTEELISKKRKSLEGVLVPLTARFNEELLKSAGFREIDTYWRCLNFMGWIAIK